jgi:hypothetical protein
MERWFTDRQGREIYSHLRLRLWRYGYALERIGFKQSKTKPYLFYLRGSKGVVFADFGGTEVIPIWEDESAYIHWQLHCPDWQKRQIIKKVRRWCGEADVPTRLSFYEEMQPDGLFFDVEPDPEPDGYPGKPDGYCKTCGMELEGPWLQCGECTQTLAGAPRPQCAACGDYFPTEQMILHHVRYEPEELVTVCRSCHLVIHRGKKYGHLRPSDRPSGEVPHA